MEKIMEMFLQMKQEEQNREARREQDRVEREDMRIREEQEREDRQEREERERKEKTEERQIQLLTQLKEAQHAVPQLVVTISQHKLPLMAKRTMYKYLSDYWRWP